MDDERESFRDRSRLREDGRDAMGEVRALPVRELRVGG